MQDNIDTIKRIFQEIYCRRTGRSASNLSVSYQGEGVYPKYKITKKNYTTDGKIFLMDWYIAEKSYPLIDLELEAKLFFDKWSSELMKNNIHIAGIE